MKNFRNNNRTKTRQASKLIPNKYLNRQSLYLLAITILFAVAQPLNAQEHGPAVLEYVNYEEEHAWVRNPNIAINPDEVIECKLPKKRSYRKVIRENFNVQNGLFPIKVGDCEEDPRMYSPNFVVQHAYLCPLSKNLKFGVTSGPQVYNRLGTRRAAVVDTRVSDDWRELEDFDAFLQCRPQSKPVAVCNVSDIAKNPLLASMVESLKNDGPRHNRPTYYKKGPFAPKQLILYEDMLGVKDISIVVDDLIYRDKKSGIATYLDISTISENQSKMNVKFALDKHTFYQRTPYEDSSKLENEVSCSKIKAGDKAYDHAKSWKKW